MVLVRTDTLSVMFLRIAFFIGLVSGLPLALADDSLPPGGEGLVVIHGGSPQAWSDGGQETGKGDGEYSAMAADGRNTRPMMHEAIRFSKSGATFHSSTVKLGAHGQIGSYDIADVNNGKTKLPGNGTNIQVVRSSDAARHLGEKPGMKDMDVVLRKLRMKEEKAQNYLDGPIGRQPPVAAGSSLVFEGGVPVAMAAAAPRHDGDAPGQARFAKAFRAEDPDWDGFAHYDLEPGFDDAMRVGYDSATWYMPGRAGLGLEPYYNPYNMVNLYGAGNADHQRTATNHGEQVSAPPSDSDSLRSRVGLRSIRTLPDNAKADAGFEYEGDVGGRVCGITVDDFPLLSGSTFMAGTGAK